MLSQCYSRHHSHTTLSLSLSVSASQAARGSYIANLERIISFPMKFITRAWSTTNCAARHLCRHFPSQYYINILESRERLSGNLSMATNSDDDGRSPQVVVEKSAHGGELEQSKFCYKYNMRANSPTIDTIVYRKLMEEKGKLKKNGWNELEIKSELLSLRLIRRSGQALKL